MRYKVAVTVTGTVEVEASDASEAAQITLREFQKQVLVGTLALGEPRKSVITVLKPHPAPKPAPLPANVHVLQPDDVVFDPRMDSV